MHFGSDECCSQIRRLCILCRYYFSRMFPSSYIFGIQKRFRFGSTAQVLNLDDQHVSFFLGRSSSKCAQKDRRPAITKRYTAEVVAAYDEAEPYLLEFQTMEEQRAAERARVGLNGGNQPNFSAEIFANFSVVSVGRPVADSFCSTSPSTTRPRFGHKLKV